MAGFDSFSASQATSGDSAFPGSGLSSSSDDSLSGVSAALGVIPVVPAKGVTQKHLNDVILDFNKMPANQKAVVQQQLYQAGYYSASYYGANPPMIVPGELNAADRAAYRSAVEDAARATEYDPTKNNTIVKPVTVADVIQQRIANRQAQGAVTGASATPQATVTAPDDIRAAVVAEAKQLYGHKADDKMVNDIISRYQARQMAAQTSTAPVAAKPPDLGTFVDDQLRTADPTGAAAHDGVGVYNDFLKLWNGRSGG